MSNETKIGMSLKDVYAKIGANLAPKWLAKAITLWLQCHRGADPQIGAGQAPLRIVGKPEFREVAPMEYEFTVRLRVDLRRRKRKGQHES
jgi:hypothetical protein